MRSRKSMVLASLESTLPTCTLGCGRLALPGTQKMLTCTASTTYTLEHQNDGMLIRLLVQVHVVVVTCFHNNTWLRVDFHDSGYICCSWVLLWVEKNILSTRLVVRDTLMCMHGCRHIHVCMVVILTCCFWAAHKIDCITSYKASDHNYCVHR